MGENRTTHINLKYKYIYLPNMKNGYTFATAMTKYMFCILVSALLLLGLHDTFQEEALESQTKTEATVKDMQTFAKHHRQALTNIRAQSRNNCHRQIFRNGSSTSKINEGILNSIVFLRNTFPLRIHKYDSSEINIETFSSLHFLVSEKERRFFFPITNSIKYSLRYYIYTLRHILI